MKAYLGAAALVVALVFAASYLSYVNSYSKSIQPGSYRSFAVTGEGKVTVVPDVAQFSFSVITQGGKNIAALQAENTANTNKAMDFLAAQNVELKDIKTSSYNLEPRYQTFNCKPEIGAVPCPPAEIVGYNIIQTVSVKIRDFAKIGDALSGVITNGANSVLSLFFTIDDPTAIEKQARDLAIAQARDKAESVAKAGGFSVGRLLSIDEGFSSFFGKGGAGGVAFDSAPSSPRIEPGSQDVTINVTLRYEIR